MSLVSAMFLTVQNFIMGILFVFGSLLHHHQTIPGSPVPSASSSINLIGASRTPPLAIKTAPTASTTQTKETKAKHLLLPKQVVHTLASTTSAQTRGLVAPTISLPHLTQDEANTVLRGSLVNILCTTSAGGYSRPISGSGVMISAKGVVLTNAHVAQFFLLRDYLRPDNVDCVIRTGNHATPQYHATLLYLPPAWILSNASQIKSHKAIGTGEDDYALLLITDHIDGTPLPTKFPHVTITIDPPNLDDLVVVAAYPAQFLTGTEIQTNLSAMSAFSTTEKLYTFATGNGPIDAISVGSPSNAQSGSSGGGVVRLQDGALEAIISTATEASSTPQRELLAITLAHIDRSMTKYGEGGLVPFLTEGSLSEKAKDFDINIAPGLAKLLENALK